ncbi:CNH domain-domain-containing protein [Absidia repens]|uniref:CNH domain-domain-containing protein n=1 Tax=Absidia repens TaxID=90262 RepID=A0A1X2IRQ7_9FUNG|nr:CNH domain-domain-containing protein [Absidia repens]
MRNIIHNTVERPRHTTQSTAASTTVTGREELSFIPISPDSSDDEDHSPTPIERQQLYERQQLALQRQLEIQQQQQRQRQQQKTGPPPPPPAHYIMVEPSAFRRSNQLHEQNTATQPRQTGSLVTPLLPQMSQLTLLSTDMDPSLLSDLSRSFIRKIKALEHVRELFCANEYPESFTGSEAVTALHSILGGRIPENYCIKVANALMHSRPILFEPVHYSQKSLITGTVYNSPDEIYTFDEDAGPNEIPNGVFTALSKCYSYTCHPQQGGCYAPQCPNKKENFEMEFHTEPDISRQSSFRSNSTINANTSYPHISWAERAPKELLDSISKREWERQEAINEMIYSEEVYRNDLDTLHDLVVIPLLESNIIDDQKRKQFVSEVFNNYYELRDISTALFKDLLDLQRRYDKKCVPMIGDIMVQHFPFFEKPFTTYCPRVPLAEYIVGMESQANPELATFLAEVVNDQRMRRLAFRHFLLNPVTRMQRYKLLLSAVLKKTDQDHADYAYLNRCIEMIGQVAAKADAQTAITEKRVEILKIDGALTFKQGESYDVQLGDTQHRKLYHRGEMKRKPTNIEVSEKSDIHAFVFDHLMLMTKHRKTSAGDEYRIWKRPIPLQMLFIQGAGNFGSMSRVPSLGGSTADVMTAGTGGGGGMNTGGTGSTIPLTLHHLGHRGRIYTFFCSTLEEKQQWVDAIEEAKAAQKRRQGDSYLFELRTLDDSSFRFISTAATSGGQGKVTCSVPFVTIDLQYKVAIGTDAGVYFKTVNQNNLRRVINCENVTQLAVMDKHHILLVLADRTLKAYPIDALNSPTNIKAPERLAQEIAQHVSFFHVGFCNNKDLLVYKKKKGASSTFSALEPLCDLRDSRNEKFLTQRTGFLGQRSNTSWFRKYMDFYVGADATNIHFLKSKLNVVCERGFEIIDPENLSVARDIPDQEDPQFNFVQRQTEPLKPLAMYRIQDKFLLCYNKFAFYVNNRNGSLVICGSGRSPLLCEWEGTPEHIVYQHPYIVAISSQFIEVRHVDTGELVQIIPGDNIRLTYYNGGGDMPIIHGCMTHGQKPDTQLIFNLWLDPERAHYASRRHPFSQIC